MADEPFEIKCESEMSLPYQVEYEVSFRMLDLLWVFLPLMFFLIGLERFRNSNPRKSRAVQKTSGIFFMLFALIVEWVSFRAVIGDYIQKKNQLRSGQYAVVEGIVERFVPMPHQGHASESFDVRGVRFSYSTYEITPCFNHTTSHGGPIREALQVRIAYVPTRDRYEPNCILRLEIADGGSLTTSPHQ